MALEHLLPTLGLAAAAALLYGLLHKSNPVFALLLSLAAGLAILVRLAGVLQGMLAGLTALAARVDGVAFASLLRCAGVLLLTDYACAVCKEAEAEAVQAAVAETPGGADAPAGLSAEQAQKQRELERGHRELMLMGARMRRAMERGEASWEDCLTDALKTFGSAHDQAYVAVRRRRFGRASPGVEAALKKQRFYASWGNRGDSDSDEDQEDHTPSAATPCN